MASFLKAITFARNLQKTMVEMKACADKHCAKEKEAHRRLQEKKMDACMKSGKKSVYECAEAVAHDKEYMKARIHAHTCINKHCKKVVETGLAKYMKKPTSSKRVVTKKKETKKGLKKKKKRSTK
jgi:response regulator RpfG family c-di-GMP phosphodiesterase